VAEVFPLAVPEVGFVDPDVGALAYRKLPGMPWLGRDLDQPEWLGPPLGRAWRDRDRERAVFYARAALIEDLVNGWRTGARLRRGRSEAPGAYVRLVRTKWPLLRIAG
jgi:hypothetical protein